MNNELGNIASDVNLLMNQRKVYFRNNAESEGFKLKDSVVEYILGSAEEDKALAMEIQSLQEKIDGLRQEMGQKFIAMDERKMGFWKDVLQIQEIEVDYTNHEKYDLEIIGDDTLTISTLPDDKLFKLEN
jgi:hypothetical protein